MAAALLLGALAVVALIVPQGGEALLTFSSNHGLDVVNIPSIVLFVAAGALLSPLPVAVPVHRALGRFRRTPLGRPDVAGLACGSVLLISGLVQLSDPSHQPRIVAAAATLVAVGSLAWLLASVGAAALVPALCFLTGAVFDARAMPSGTLFAPATLAVALAVGREGIARAALVMAALGCGVLSVLSLSDVARIDIRLATWDGGPGRTAALGAVLLVWAALHSGMTLKSSKRALPGPVETP
jgi:hypothetical protein